jgi:hypothetical protein
MSEGPSLDQGAIGVPVTEQKAYAAKRVHAADIIEKAGASTMGTNREPHQPKNHQRRSLPAACECSSRDGQHLHKLHK